MNISILTMSLAKLQAEYILAYGPFLLDARSNKTTMWVVQPDKLHEFPKTYSDRMSNLHGYMLKVSLFNDRPATVLRYDKLTGRQISEGRDGAVLDTITTGTNFTPVIIIPRH
jgi:hypothetical protein